MCTEATALQIAQVAASTVQTIALAYISVKYGQHLGKTKPV